MGRARREHPKSNQLWVSPNKIESCLLGLFLSLPMHLFSRYGICPVKTLRRRKRPKAAATSPRTPRTDAPFPRLAHSGGAEALSQPPSRTRRSGHRRAHTGVTAHAVQAAPRARPPCGSRTHPRAALLHGGQHSQGAGRPRAEVKEVQRRARCLLQEPARDRRVLLPPGVLGTPGPRGRRRCSLEGEQQQQGEQRGSGARVPGPRRGLRLPAGLHGRRRASAALDGLREGDDGAGENKVAEGPAPRPRGGRELGSPLGSSAPPHSACPGSEPGRSGAATARGCGCQARAPRTVGQWRLLPRGRAFPRRHPGPQPSSRPGFSPLRVLKFRNRFSE